MEDYSDYFTLRNVDEEFYSQHSLPAYIKNILPDNKNAKILDIGCGIGITLNHLKNLGYNNLKGIDISEEAVAYCLKKNLDVEKNEILEYCNSSAEKYDLIIMSHVLEHIEKDKTIEILKNIRGKLLNENGALCLAVPNAQSNTGAYWAYEDFTHYTLFTSGSLIYVLKAAGFKSINFLDVKGIEGTGFLKKIIKLFFLKIYDIKNEFWNKITSSSFHQPSPRIYSFEIKVLAKNG